MILVHHLLNGFHTQLDRNCKQPSWESYKVAIRGGHRRCAVGLLCKSLQRQYKETGICWKKEWGKNHNMAPVRKEILILLFIKRENKRENTWSFHACAYQVQMHEKKKKNLIWTEETKFMTPVWLDYIVQLMYVIMGL